MSNNQFVPLPFFAGGNRRDDENEAGQSFLGPPAGNSSQSGESGNFPVPPLMTATSSFPAPVNHGSTFGMPLTAHNSNFGSNFYESQRPSDSSSFNSHYQGFQPLATPAQQSFSSAPAVSLQDSRPHEEPFVASSNSFGTFHQHQASLKPDFYGNPYHSPKLNFDNQPSADVKASENHWQQQPSDFGILPPSSNAMPPSLFEPLDKQSPKKAEIETSSNPKPAPISFQPPWQTSAFSTEPTKLPSPSKESLAQFDAFPTSSPFGGQFQVHTKVETDTVVESGPLGTSSQFGVGASRRSSADKSAASQPSAKLQFVPEETLSVQSSFTTSSEGFVIPQVEGQKACPRCAKQNELHANFCCRCGAQIGSPVFSPTSSFEYGEDALAGKMDALNITSSTTATPSKPTVVREESPFAKPFSEPHHPTTTQSSSFAPSTLFAAAPVAATMTSAQATPAVTAKRVYPVFSFGFGGVYAATFPVLQTRYNPNGQPVHSYRPSVMYHGDGLDSIPFVKKSFLDLITRVDGGLPFYGKNAKSLANVISHFEIKDERNVFVKLFEVLLNCQGRIDQPDVVGKIVDLVQAHFSSSSTFESNGMPVVENPKAVAEFSQLLLQGDKVTACEYAINNRLWSHALLLSSQTNPSLHEQTIGAFAKQEFPVGHPVRLLYLIFANEWASLESELSQSLDNWPQKFKAIMTTSGPTYLNLLNHLAQSLYRSGQLIPGQLCDLTLGLDSRCGLIGNVSDAFDFESLRLTELYEAIRATYEPTYMMHSLLPLKFAFINMLLDFGLGQLALKHTHAFGMAINKHRLGTREILELYEILNQRLETFAEGNPKLSLVTETESGGSGWLPKVSGLMDVFDRGLNKVIGVEEPSPSAKAKSPALVPQFDIAPEKDLQVPNFKEPKSFGDASSPSLGFAPSQHQQPGAAFESSPKMPTFAQPAGEFSSFDGQRQQEHWMVPQTGAPAFDSSSKMHNFVQPAGEFSSFDGPRQQEQWAAPQPGATSFAGSQPWSAAGGFGQASQQVPGQFEQPVHEHHKDFPNPPVGGFDPFSRKNSIEDKLTPPLHHQKPGPQQIAQAAPSSPSFAWAPAQEQQLQQQPPSQQQGMQFQQFAQTASAPWQQGQFGVAPVEQQQPQQHYQQQAQEPLQSPQPVHPSPAGNFPPSPQMQSASAFGSPHLAHLQSMPNLHLHQQQASAYGEEFAVDRKTDGYGVAASMDDFGFGNQSAKTEQPQPDQAQKPQQPAENVDSDADSKSSKLSFIWNMFGKRKDTASPALSTGSSGPVKANLGEGMQLVYDESLKKWVNKSTGAPVVKETGPVAPPPTSSIGSSSGSGDSLNVSYRRTQSGARSKYVDTFNPSSGPQTSATPPTAPRSNLIPTPSFAQMNLSQDEQHQQNSGFGAPEQHNFATPQQPVQPSSSTDFSNPVYYQQPQQQQSQFQNFQQPFNNFNSNF